MISLVAPLSFKPSSKIAMSNTAKPRRYFIKKQWITPHLRHNSLVETLDLNRSHKLQDLNKE